MPKLFQNAEIIQHKTTSTSNAEKNDTLSAKVEPKIRKLWPFKDPLLV